FSINAREKIEAAGGTVVELGERKKKKPHDRGSVPNDKYEDASQASQAPAGEDAPEGEDDGSGGYTAADTASAAPSGGHQRDGPTGHPREAALHVRVNRDLPVRFQCPRPGSGSVKAR